MDIILLRFIRLQVLCLTFAQAAYAEYNQELKVDIALEQLMACWEIGSRGIGTISYDICSKRLRNECSGLSAHDKLKCVKSFAEKIDREIKLEFLALKSSRKNVTISKSRLPRISDSLREAEKKISDMCLTKSPLESSIYKWSRGYVHCGYFHGMYIQEIRVHIVRRWFRNQFTGYSLETNVNENSIGFIRTFIDKDFELRTCFEQMMAFYQREERSVEDSCFVDGFTDKYGENLAFRYWAHSNTIELIFSKKP